MSKNLFKKTTVKKIEQAAEEVTDALARGGVSALDEKRAAGMLLLALGDLKTRFTPEDLSFIIEHDLSMVEPGPAVAPAQELANEDLTAACKEIMDALKEGGLGTIGLEHSRALLWLAIRQLLPILSAGTLRRRIELIRESVQMPSPLRKDDLN